MHDDEVRTEEERDRWRRLAAGEPGTLLFETTSDSAGPCYLFRNPERILQAHDAASLAEMMAELDPLLAAGFHVAGLVRYEAAYSLERVRNRQPRQEPLAWFGVYRERAEARFGRDNAPSDGASLVRLFPAAETTRLQYLERVEAAQRYIRNGDTYQVNLTTALTSSYAGDALSLYRAVTSQQPAPFSSLLHLPDGEIVLSTSPELFFSTEPTRQIRVRPMKGPVPAGSSEAENEALSSWLRNDGKNRAEHLMIVDLLRNDLGRICDPGTVAAEQLFEVERYSTLLQMTSTITGQLGSNVTLGDTLRALFPSGSMTGAPKPRTMEIVAELEPTPRGVYSGAIGFAAPDGSAVFSVAIRSLVLKDRQIRMGVGGGIVADSTPEQEWEECWWKSRFLLLATAPFNLVETLLWDSRFLLWEEHMARLQHSAEQLHFCFDKEAIRAQAAAFALPLKGRRRVRFELARGGEIRISESAVREWNTPARVLIDAERSWSGDSCLRFKTTFRPFYDRAQRDAERLGLDDVLFTNERDELTEGCISSLLVKLDGTWWTPDLRCGLLPGVSRSLLLERGVVRERTITLADLGSAEGVALANGVRGTAAVSAVTLRDGRTLQFDPAVVVPALL